ncbi:MAG: hypothetical protein ACI9QC_000522 [Oceanicoccus sp.]|jgi:hypothetical protein
MHTSEQILELANSLKGTLKDEQVARITKIAANLSSDQAEKLHAKLMELQTAHIEKMKKEIDVRQRMNAEFKAFNSHKQTANIKAEEAKEQVEANAEADRLLEELNQL